MPALQETLLDKRIATRKAEIQRRLAEGIITQEQLDAASEAAMFDDEEIRVFQDLKSFAFVSGLIDQDMAQQIYILLGGESGTASHINKQPIEVRTVMNSLFLELLKWRTKR